MYFLFLSCKFVCLKFISNYTDNWKCSKIQHLNFTSSQATTHSKTCSAQVGSASCSWVMSPHQLERERERERERREREREREESLYLYSEYVLKLSYNNTELTIFRELHSRLPVLGEKFVFVLKNFSKTPTAMKNSERFPGIIYPRTSGLVGGD